MPLVGGADLNGPPPAIRPIYGSIAHVKRVRSACKRVGGSMEVVRQTHPGSRAQGEKAVGKGYLSNAHYDDPQEACEVAAASYAQEVAGTILHSLRRGG
eukprot:1776116-Pleurochrysis_carterae.AAC.1